MKKVAFMVLVVCINLCVVNAQEKRQVEVGLGIGSNLSSISITTNGQNPKIDNMSGPNYALSTEYYFSNRWGIKFKFIYDKKGWNYTNATLDDYGQSVLVSNDVRLNYLTIPVTGNWHFGAKRGWYLNAGPYIGFLLNADEVKVGNSTNEYQKVDTGLALQVGHKFALTKFLKLFLEFEFQGGVTSVFSTSYNYHGNNSRTSFNIGFAIPLNKPTVN